MRFDRGAGDLLIGGQAVVLAFFDGILKITSSQKGGLALVRAHKSWGRGGARRLQLRVTIAGNREMRPVALKGSILKA